MLSVALLAAMVATPASPPAVDHSAFDALLRRHVTDGLVDYDAFGRSEELPRCLDRPKGRARSTR